ncbi:MAG: T9SS type A sorting domain-containing protein [Bacteroidota bacterium]
MKAKFYLFSALLCLTAATSMVNAQGTFTQIHQILQTNCAGSSCHGAGASNPSFNVDASESVLYNKLVNGTVINPGVKAGDKLITPGYVDRSFLLRKLIHGLNENNPHLNLTGAQEGVGMPYGLPALPKEQIELVRQWILFGAPQTGHVIDTAVINSYYRGKGIDDTYANHAAPAPNEGFQIYLGKVFIPASTEIYYYIKHNPRLTSSIEIPKVTTMLASATHHWVIFKFLPSSSSGYAEGLRLEAQSSHADVSDGIGTGPNLWEYELPQGTAYFWEQSTVLDFNLHIFNPRTDTVLATDLYVNIYTQPLGTAQKYMLIRNYPVFSIAIPPDSVEHEFVEVANDTNETKYWNVWQLYGHTHKYGTDYDIFTRNPDGSMGEQQYESWMSYEQGFNVGYHRFGVDATFRFYPDDSLLQIDPRIGWVHRARYKNNSQDTVYWGLTSAEEMMVMGFQYVYGDDLGPLPTGIGSSANETLKLNVFPNPANDVISLNYSLYERTDLKVELTNVLGETVSLLEEKNKVVGNYLDEVDLRQYSPGVYLLNFKTNYSSTTRRIVIE